MFQGFIVSFSTNPADIGQLGSILELSSPDESQPLVKESPKKKVSTPQKDVSLVPQKRGTPKTKTGAAKSLIRSFAAVNDSVNTDGQQISFANSPNKRLKLSEQRDLDLKEAEQMQAKAHKLGETFITGKKLCEDPELNGVLEKAKKKKRKKGRLASDDSLYRDTIEDVEENLVIDENAKENPGTSSKTGNNKIKVFEKRSPNESPR